MRVLVVVHGLPPSAWGGAEIHAWDLARELSGRAGDTVTILTREADPSRAEHALRRETRGDIHIAWINNTFGAIRAFSDNYDDDRITRMAEAVIDEYRPDVAHIHHLTCLSTGLIRALKTRGVPVVMTLHDYWLICHRGQLLDVDCAPCAGPEPAGCQRCLGAAGSMPAWAFAARRSGARTTAVLPRVMRGAVQNLIVRMVKPDRDRAGGRPVRTRADLDEAARRFRHMRALLSDVDLFLAPSQHLLERFVHFGVPRDRIRLAEYGVDRAHLWSARRSAPRAEGPLRLACLGSLMISKGAHVLLEAFRTLPPGAATLDLFGPVVSYHGEATYEATLAPLLITPGVRVHATVDHDGVPNVFGSIDLLVVPSIWEENSPIVIREAFAAGVPVVGANIGGIAETLAHERGGLLFQAGDAADLARALRRVIDTPALLSRLRESVPSVPDLSDEAGPLRSVLASLVASVPSSPRPVVPSSRSVSSVRIVAIVVNFRAADDTLLAVHSLLSSDTPFQRVIVVDNDADGRARQTLAAVWHAIDYLPMPENVGFPAAVNAGMARAFAEGARHVLLLNSDALVRPDCVTEMLRVMDECAAGIVGPTVLSRSDPGVVSSAGITFNARTGRMTQPGHGAPRDAKSRPSAVAVDAVSGCAMLIDRAATDIVGVFDPSYFFGFEDIDLCCRAWAAGIPVVVASRAVAYHEGSRSLGRTSSDRFYYAARSHLRLTQSTNPRAGVSAAFARSAIVIALNLAYALRADGGTVFGRAAASLRGSRDGVRRRDGAAPIRHGAM